MLKTTWLYRTVIRVGNGDINSKSLEEVLKEVTTFANAGQWEIVSVTPLTNPSSVTLVIFLQQKP